MSNILFYSDKCQFSLKFIEKLKEQQLLYNSVSPSPHQFKLINVMETKNIPENIKSIPTIIVQNINVPLSGSDAFNWVDNFKFFYRETNNINKTKNIENIKIQVDNTMNAESIKNKKSDEYANLKDEDDDKITKTKYNGVNQNISITNLDSLKETIHEDKINGELQNKKVDDLIEQRKYQMQLFINAKNKKR